MQVCRQDVFHDLPWTSLLDCFASCGMVTAKPDIETTETRLNCSKTHGSPILPHSVAQVNHKRYISRPSHHKSSASGPSQRPHKLILQKDQLGTYFHVATSSTVISANICIYDVLLAAAYIAHLLSILFEPYVASARP